MAKSEAPVDVSGLIEVPLSSPPNPEAAAEALASALPPMEDGTIPKAPPHFAPPPPAAPKRRTKAELEAALAAAEAENARLAAVASMPEAAAIARAPLALNFRAAFSALASFRGEHWTLQEKEGDMLAEAWAPVIGPAIQNNPQAVIWASAVAVSYSVVAPRIKQDKDKAEKAVADASPQ